MKIPDDISWPSLRDEFLHTAKWGYFSEDFHRYEILSPKINGPILGVSKTVGCIHSDRSTLCVRIDGAHLQATTDELFILLREKAAHQLKVQGRDPVEYVSEVSFWLEKEVKEGFLKKSLTSFIFLVAISDSEVWTWLVSPNGVGHGKPERIVFDSTDLRCPVLRKLGILNDHVLPSLEKTDNANSIFFIGCPLGYERIRTHLEPGEMVVALESGVFPYGDLSSLQVPLTALWKMDAAWKYGLAGCAVVYGQIAREELDVPEGWEVSEIPFLGGESV